MPSGSLSTTRTRPAGDERALRLPLTVERSFPESARVELVALRRDLHRHPELSGVEERTARTLSAALERLRPSELHRVGGTGVVARFRGRNADAPVVAVRGDIDALPIEEATGLDFASSIPGVMHACGHDVHATWAVGAAHLLAQQPAEGDVLIVLQPAEETGRGALAILESGILDNVAAIFGAHVDRRFSTGQVIAQAGPLAASADEFTIELTGTGAHAARPHEAADPIVGAAAVISALQTIVARRVDPSAPAVVTVGSVHAGSAANIIPDRAQLRGTLRATDPATRRLLHDEVRHIASATGAAHRLAVNVTIELGPPPIVNPAGPAAWAREAATSLLGAEAIVPLGFINLAGEDFAHYMERFPGCFLRIGAREEGGETIAAHSGRFYAAEESIFIGAAVLAETARVASAALLLT